MQTEKLYFRVDFEGLTRQLRDFWAEGSYKHAIDYGMACGPNKEQVEDIIRGKLKMVQDPDGKDGVDGMLVEDNWTPDLSMCHYCKYPDPNDLYKMAEESFSDNDFIDKVHLSDLQDIGDEIGEAYARSNMEEARELWELVDKFPENIREQVEIPWSRKLAFEGPGDYFKEIEERNRARYDIPTVSEYFNKEQERNNRETPKPTKDLKWDNGWLLPNGKFYPCEGGTMEHIWLADRLGKTENEAEQAGWIKLGKGMLGIHICTFKKPTKKQFNFLFDWSEFKNDRQKEYENFIKFNCFAKD